MAARRKSRAAVTPSAPTLFEQPKASPLELLQRRDQSALAKATTLSTWAMLPDHYRSSFPDIPSIEPAYLVKLLEELQRIDKTAAEHDAAVLGVPVDATDLSAYLKRARQLAASSGPPAASDSKHSNGHGRTHSKRSNAGQNTPLLDPLETTCISAPDNGSASFERVEWFRRLQESRDVYQVDQRPATILTRTKRKGEIGASHFLESTDPLMQKRGDRLSSCCTRYGLKVDAETGDILSRVLNFCRDRFCPTCQQKRALEVRRCVRRACREILTVFPEMRFAMLTLTCKNVPPNQVGSAADDLRKAFGRFVRLKGFPAVGYLTFLEVTHGDGGSAHPHLHCLLALLPEYFTDRGPNASYMDWDRWVNLWQRALRVKYRPVVHITAVKPTRKMLNRWRGQHLSLVDRAAECVAITVAEVAKYPMKYDDKLLEDGEWFRTVARELQGKRAYTAGGLFAIALRGAKQQEEREKKEKQKERDKRPFRIFWYVWNGWDYIRATPFDESQLTNTYHAHQAGAFRGGGP